MADFELPGKPTCPNCGKNQEVAMGEEMPKNGDYCICSYCASINRYELTSGEYKIRICNDEDIFTAASCGMLPNLLAVQDFIKIKITR